MFRDVITSTALTTDIANDVLSNVKADSITGDVSFTATLRALIAPKLAEGEELIMSYDSVYLGIPSDSNEWLAARIDTSQWDKPMRLHIINNSDYNTESAAAAFDYIDKRFCSVYPDWNGLEKDGRKFITEFYQKAFKVLCFVNTEIRSTILFTFGMDLRRVHFLQCAIPAYLPWFYPTRPTPEETDLLRSLQLKEPDAYLERIAGFAKTYDFRTLNIKKQLAGFEVQYERNRKTYIERKLADINARIRRLNEDYRSLGETKRTYNIELLGLDAKINSKSADDGDTEIMRYFMRNNYLVLEHVDDECMTFGVKGYITYYDEEYAKSIINNSSSYVYAHQRGSISCDEMGKLMKAIFIDQRLKLRVCAKYQLRLSGSVYALDGQSFDSPEYKDYMPNPHINTYACMGTEYPTIINEMIGAGNYVGAVEQCVSSCGSLNFEDSIVMKSFMWDLYDSHYKCVELPDGTVVTPTQAVQFLNTGEE